MSKLKIPYHPSSIVLCLTLLAAPSLELSAQDVPANAPQQDATSTAGQLEVPAGAPQDGEAKQTERIVDGRPTLYFFKHAINPLTWFEAGARPIFRSAENGALHRLISKRRDTDKSAEAGFKLGVTGAGTGSGFGPQVTPFHKNLFGRGIEIEAPLLFTYKRYEVYEFNARLPLISEGFVNRLTLDIGSDYRSRNADSFFGIGNDSRHEDESSFRTVQREASIGLSAQINDEWKSGLHVAYRNIGVTDPRGRRSAQDDFRNSDVPGLFTGAKLRSSVLFLDRDTQDDKHLPTQGGLEHFEVSLNEGVGKGDFSYWKYRLVLQRYFALSSDKRKVLAIRGMAETNQEKGGSRVPFFDMPVIGDWDTLRGFDNYRFYDKSALSLGVEYRYRIWRAFDWAIFLDEGQVAPQPGDFGLHRFHTGYGVSFIARPKPDWPVGIDVGRSNESWRVYLSLNRHF